MNMRLKAGFLRHWICGVFLGLAFCSTTSGAPAEPGLYVRFQTNQGLFWARLHYDRAPRTVANFISLASGSREWLDFLNPGIARRKFYDGLTFHRVISGFMIQGGSPNGQGTDGPGYRFRDEFHSTLRHNRAGILSMANSGPNSNGSQFFITLGPTAWLDDVHSIFGEIVEGLDVVQAIGVVPVGLGDRPVTPVRMETVDVVAIGSEAEQFVGSELTVPLPGVGAVESRLALANGELLLSFESVADRIHYAFFTPDLTTWQFQAFDPRQGTLSPLRATGIFKSQPNHFFMILTGGFE
jgi:cyclophilin family peptidyl-prolyl cis-trans isomerase